MLLNTLGLLISTWTTPTSPPIDLTLKWLNFLKSDSLNDIFHYKIQNENENLKLKSEFWHFLKLFFCGGKFSILPKSFVPENNNQGVNVRISFINFSEGTWRELLSRVRMALEPSWSRSSEGTGLKVVALDVGKHRISLSILIILFFLNFLCQIWFMV